MINYNPIYRKFIDDRNMVSPAKITRGKFYQIKKYEYADGTHGNFSETAGPIIFTLYVSHGKDIMHCVKVSNINPAIIRRFFGKFVNDKTEKIQMRGNAKDIYERVVSRIPVITDDAYRTYNITGIKTIIELDMDVNEITPKNKNVTGIDKSSQKRNI